MKEVHVLHYAGRGTPEANEIEGVFATYEALLKNVMNNHPEKTKEEVEEMLDEGEHLYYSSYKVKE